MRSDACIAASDSCRRGWSNWNTVVSIPVPSSGIGGVRAGSDHAEVRYSYGALRPLRSWARA